MKTKSTIKETVSVGAVNSLGTPTSSGDIGAHLSGFSPLLTHKTFRRKLLDFANRWKKPQIK